MQPTMADMMKYGFAANETEKVEEEKGSRNYG